MTAEEQGGRVVKIWRIKQTKRGFRVQYQSGTRWQSFGPSKPDRAGAREVMRGAQAQLPNIDHQEVAL